MSHWSDMILITPAAYQALAKGLCAGIAPGDSAQDMFLTGLSADGSAPATHYISDGYIKPEFAALLGNANATYAAAQEAGASVTLQQIQALYAASVFRNKLTDNISTAQLLDDLGLQFVRGDV
jgi:hypothetical protein